MLLAGRRFAASPARCRPLLRQQSRCWPRRRLYGSSGAAPAAQPGHEPRDARPGAAAPAASPTDAGISAAVASTGSAARSRAARAARATGSGYPPVDMPQWFLDHDVTLLQENNYYPKPGCFHLRTGEAGARHCLVDALFKDMETFRWKTKDVSKVVEALSSLDEGPETESRLRSVGSLITLRFTFAQLAAEAIVAMAYQLRDGALSPIESFMPPALPCMRPETLSPARLRSGEVRARRSSRSLASESVLALHWEHHVTAAFDDECVPFAESVAAQIRAVAASRPRPKPRPKPALGAADASAGRPVPVLAVMNQPNQAIPRVLVERTARRTKADVIHLDTHTLAHIAGAALGQDLYAHKGPFSMMGYRVDELSGRLAPRFLPDPEAAPHPDGGPEPGADSDSGSAGGVYTVSSNQLRSMLLGSESAPSPTRVADWDDLKLSHALEQILGAADLKRARLPEPEPPLPDDDGPRPLIVHVQDIAELLELGEGGLIVSKLRAAVDRLADGGRPITLVGSSSHAAVGRAWHKQLSTLADQLNCNIHPLDCPPLSPENSRLADAFEQRAVAHRNMSNITSMLEAMLGQEVIIALGPDADTIPLVNQKYYDLQWAHDLASKLLCKRRKPLSPLRFDFSDLRGVLDWLQNDHQAWKEKPGYSKTSPYPWSSVLANRAGLSSSDAQKSSSSGDSVRGTFSSGSNNGADEGHSGGGSSSNAKNNAKNIKYDENEQQLLSCIVKPETIKTTWDSVVCSPETKDSLQALTSLVLTRPSEFSYGVLASERIAGCLLYGPPGTGKTLMAKAIAKESGATMLEVSAAAINDRWVGASERNVRALFSLARKLAPVVIFLDEADSLLGSRESRARGGHRETVNQFLREWDGLAETNAFIMVATNRPFDLDEAVLRRLPRKILVDLPLAANRLDILRVLLRDELLDPATVSLERLAADTELYSGSDLKHLCVAAAFHAVRDSMKARDASPSPTDFVFPDRRTLTGSHFARAMHEVSASVSPDTGSLKAIRKFDERFGDGQTKRKKTATAMGFAVAPVTHRSETARIRRELADDA